MIEEEKAIKWECVGDIISTKKNGFLCPTQALLARWLREKYEIHVEVVFWYYKDSHYCEYTYNITKPLENLTNNVLWFDNYEEAMEEGLKEALKLI